MRMIKHKPKVTRGEREETSLNWRRLLVLVVVVMGLCGALVWWVYPYLVDPEPVVEVRPYGWPSPSAGPVTILPFASATPAIAPAASAAPTTTSPGSVMVAINTENAVFVTQVGEMSGPGDVSSVAFKADVLASGSRDGTIHLWAVATGAEVRQVHSASNRVDSVAFSADGQMLAAVGQDNVVRLWDQNLNELDTLEGPSGAVRSVAFSAQGDLLAAGSDDTNVYLWNVATKELVATLQGHRDYVTSVAFTWDGTVLASGSADDTVRLWKVPSGTAVGVLQHASNVGRVAFDPDGEKLAATSGDLMVYVWDWRSGAELFRLQGHTENVNSVAFSPDGSLIASGSGGIQDNTVRFWDAENGRNVWVVNVDAPVNSIAFSPNGRLVAVGGPNNLGLWGVTGEQTPAAAVPTSPSGAGVPTSTPAAPISAVPTAAVSDDTACVVTAIQDEINLREGPGVAYDVLARLPLGGRYESDGWAQDGEGYTWWRLKSGGWVRADTVNFPAICLELSPVSTLLEEAIPPTHTAATPADGCVLTVRLDEANVRTGPGAAYDAAGSLALGETVQADGYAQDGEGYTWWRLTSGSWARGDVFDTSLLTDACYMLPWVEPS